MTEPETLTLSSLTFKFQRATKQIIGSTYEATIELIED